MGRMHGVLGIFVLLVATVAAAHAAKSEDVTYKSGNDTVKGYVASPGKPGHYPGLIIIHEFNGLDEWVKEQARTFADLGYVVLAVDLYRGQRGYNREESRKLVENVPAERKNRDLKVAYDYLAARPEFNKGKIGALGWCFGGRATLQFAEIEPRLAAVAIYYGELPVNPLTGADSKEHWSQATPAQAAAIHAAILGNFGEDDKNIPPALVREFETALKKAGKEVDIKIYPGAGHVFARKDVFAKDDNEAYRPAAAKDAWNRTIKFLEKTLKSS